MVEMGIQHVLLEILCTYLVVMFRKLKNLAMISISLILQHQVGP